MSHTDPVEAVQAAYARIASSAARHVWIALRPEADAVADARAVRARLRANEPLPLAGLVFAVKDNIDVAGMPTTAAHPAFSSVPARTASAVLRLTDAGAVLVGKTNLDQFATGLVGTRSPYGAVSSAADPARVSGGSSSGSGAAVGLGLVDFALGTDTAGSGRVPAAFNGVVGVKPTLGLVAKDGVVPACPSYDTVSVFAPDVVSAARVLAVAVGASADDPSSRPWPSDAPQGAPARPVVAVPRDEDLGALSAGARAAFDAAVARTEGLGATVRRVDLTPFLEAGRLLYDGGLVAERAWSFGGFLAEHPEDADPSVAAIARAAGAVPGVRTVADQQRLRVLTAQGRAALLGAHALMVPTTPVHPTHEEVAADPIGLNSTIGTFTTFVNLVDMAAVAVPAGRVDGGGLFGVTFVVPAFHDQVAVDLAARFLGEGIPAVLGAPGTEVAVFGAHLRGEPLNAQLEALGGRYVRDVATAPTFRMLLVEGDVERPAVVRGEPGASIPGELWRLSAHGLAELLTSVAAPLALGPVELDDGTAVVGFVAAPLGTETDITHLGGWRGYRHARPVAASV